ncbi:ArnT family glycosyltransferase [Asticcacaulis tiandongensis]|uniref:ArnT family glycosyltransferase n=1 Tax=Asticcacaulis tiandongensis TaxID=2565365 RepID=UPI0015E83D6C|nr:glycosyltransferase family 39 protein [Asticcacaulis tiandongensis]
MDTSDTRWRFSPYVLWGLTGLLALRVILLFTNFTDLYPDEAQYWLWSRELDFGYYSKPPMIAWLIHLTTLIGGNGEAFVRLSAPFLHFGTALLLWATGRRWFNDATGALAALVYSFMPAVVLSSAIISTDAPLLFFLSLSLYIYVRLIEGAADARLKTALALGAAFGLAFLSKYACLYFLIGASAHALLSPRVRKSWSWLSLAAFAAAFALVISPNLLWNAAHGFQTVSHTADNANWQASRMFNLDSLTAFVRDQFGVFGPAPFIILLVAAAGLLIKPLLPRDAEGRIDDRILGLIALSLPPLIFVTIQAFLSRAHANWAASAYAPASLLIAALLHQGIATRSWAKWGVRLSAVFQVSVLIIFMLAAISPTLTRTFGLDNVFKRARGWEATTFAVIEQATTGPRPTAIAVDNRNIYNALAYYGRDWFAANPDVPLKAWVREAQPKSQAETETPLTEATGGNVLILSYVPRFEPEIRADFASSDPARSLKTALDHKRTRDFSLFYAHGFQPVPREGRQADTAAADD